MAIKLSNNKKRRLTAMADQAMALAAQGKFDAALLACDQGDAVSQDYPDIMYARGLVAGMQQDYAEAGDWFGRAHRASPKRIEFMANYAGCLLMLDQEEEAASLYREVLRLKPRLTEGAFGLGASLAALSEFREAIAVFDGALRQEPRQVKLLKKLASIYNEIGDTDASLELLQKAHSLIPTDTDVLHSIGVCLVQKGDIPAAEEFLRKAMKLDSDYVDALSILVDIGRQPDVQQDIDALSQLYARLPSDSPARAVAAFVMGTEADKAGQYDDAFTLWSEGNRIRREHLNYDEEEQSSLHSVIETAFPADRFMNKPEQPLTAIEPIFVVGMPRCGSTLLEQALSRHPDLQAGGELNAMQQAIVGRGHKIRTSSLIDILKDTDDLLLAKIGEEYARLLQQEYGLTGRVIDKALNNYLFAGLIVRAIPNARIIHVKRDPMATCLSMYQQDFVEDVAYSFDLAEMGRQYGRYHALMQHWRQVLPQETLLEVSYEDLVANPEQELHRLLDACGLKWDARCLSSHEAEGTVATASILQVRQPIHQKSVARWKHYEGQLAPLKPFFSTLSL